jgi:peptidoglycan/LPS O-acetylase OafA/YrhL
MASGRAILCVIVNHFSEAILPSGFLGVDIFFVLSGYVVSKSIAERPTANWRMFLAEFYARRVKRIVPALVFCVTISALLSCLFIQYPIPTLTAGLYALIGTSNIYFFSRSSDYFGEDARHNLFTHTWSLGVEEQFYLLFPLLFLLAGTRKLKTGGGSVLILLLAIFTTASLALWFYFSSRDPSFTHFMIPTRFWQLGLGCLVFFASRTRGIAPGYSKYISAISVLVMLVIPFLPKEQAAYTAVVLCLAAAALIYSLSYKGLVVHILSTPWMVSIGLLSYSLYLWHWPVISLSRHTVGIGMYTVVPQVVLMCALAMFSYRFIEQPCRYGKLSRSRSNINIIFIGALAIMLSASLLYGLHKWGHRMFSANNPTFKLVRPTFPLDPTFEQCGVDYDFSTKTLPCYFSNPAGAEGTLWMLGDSTTWALKGMASDVSGDTGLDIAMFAENIGLPATRIIQESGPQPRLEAQKVFFKKAFAHVYRHAKAGDLVLITADLMDRFCVHGELYCRRAAENAPLWKHENGTLLNHEQAFQAFLDEMADYDAKLRTKGARIIISAPLPRWERQHSIYCERQWFRPFWENEKCRYPDVAAQQASRKRILSFLRKANDTSDMLVYDPFPYLCNPQSCDFSNPETNENYWIDETHLSTAGGSRLAPHFIAFLKSNKLISSK